MAKKEAPNKIPKKFRKLNKSFIDHIQNSNNHFFMSFPKNLTFLGKEQDENVVLIIRTHWVLYIPFIFVAIAILCFPILITLAVPQIRENISLCISFWIISLLISFSILIYSFVRWFYNVNIITDQRVIDLDFTSALSHTSSEARLERIEDVTHKQIGILSSIFDLGTVYIQTAGAKAEIEFDNIPRPSEVQDILYDLLESKQKGEI